MLDPSAFTLTPNGARASPTRNVTSPPAPSGGGSSSFSFGGGSGIKYVVNDPRWKFVDENVFPKPRDFQGGPRKYRAGRGSSVPLDLSAL